MSTEDIGVQDYRSIGVQEYQMSGSSVKIMLSPHKVIIMKGNVIQVLGVIIYGQVL